LKSRSSEQGFALVSVLLVLGVIASVLVMLQSTTRSMASGIEAEIRIRQARHMADAGLARIMSAFDDPDDDMIAQLREAHELRWRYDETEIDLSLISESGKIDLNAGDPELIRSAVQQVTSDSTRALEIYKGILDRRAKGIPFSSPAEILLPQERLNSLADMTRELFTVLTGARGIDPFRASATVLKALPGIGERDLARLEESRREFSLVRHMQQLSHLMPVFSTERPIYTLRAAVAVPNGGKIIREAVVIIQRNEPRVLVISQGNVISSKLSID
jgi:general secretion pathway protein K